MMIFSSSSPSPWLPTAVLGGGIVTASAVYVGVMRRYRSDMRQIRATMSHQTLSFKNRFQSTSGATVHYMERTCRSSQRVCLVLHPSGGGCDQGLLLGELLLPDDCTILAPSRAGYLQTSDDGLEAEAQWMVELLDHHCTDSCGGGPVSVSILACSAGSLLALEIARRYPAHVHSLILLSPLIPCGKKESLPSPPQWILQVAFGNDFVKWMFVRLFPNITMKSMFGTTNFTKDRQLESKCQAILETMLPAKERFPGFLRDFECMMTHCVAEQEIVQPLERCHILFLASRTDAQSKLEYNRLPQSIFETKQTTMTVTRREIIREAGTHMLLNDIVGTKNEIEVFLKDATS